MESFLFMPGRTRLLVSIPHAGTALPAGMAARMTAAGRALPDTDWHLPRLYDFLQEAGASVLVATQSRYVVDLNRPADDAPLYPGQAGSGLCPLQTFDGEDIWLPGEAPGPAEVAGRVRVWWQPYHQRLREALEALRERHGSAVLWDAHSIRSRLPRLFEGELPVLNFGSNGGRSCGPGLLAALLAAARAAPAYPMVLDGRFKGGHITRAYGDPARGVHAVQLELAQRSYMDEASAEYRAGLAQDLRPLLREFIRIAVG